MLISKKKVLKKETPKLFRGTSLDKEFENLLREGQLDYEKKSKNSSTGNWFKYSKRRSKLSSVVKEKQEVFIRKCSISLKVSKDLWNFINNAKSKTQSVNISTVKSSFGDLIVDDKKIAEHFNLISNHGQFFDREYQRAPIYKAGDESFSVCPITEKDYDILKPVNPHKPTGPRKVPAWSIVDGQLILVPI